MKHISITPFGRRPNLACVSAHHAMAEAPCPAMPVDKWAVLRDLTAGRHAFAVSDRDLAVLQALISFHPAQMLTADVPVIVFPSNLRLSERLHGMPESTLRRHLAALVGAGLILRHDSPNGKRFARRDDGGGIARAFGFDLRPLIVRAEEIALAADHARREMAECRALREEIVLHLRDVVALTGITVGTVDLQRQLRRKLPLAALRDLALNSAALASATRPALPRTDNSGGCDSRNERHIQESNKIPSESESCDERQDDPPLHLATVLAACPASADYAPEPIRDWPGVVALARTICPMMGIAQDVFQQAQRHMGAIGAAITVLCLLERFQYIARPGAYLRSLAQKAGRGGFRVAPMIRALLAVRVGS